MSVDLRAAAAAYLAARRARGYRLADHDWLIRSFLDDLERRGLATITVADAVAFARSRAQSSPRWHAQRLHVIAGLANYVHTLDPAAAELVPAGLIRARTTRRHPYLYSDEQVQALLAAAAALAPPLAATMSTLIGLLAVSGLRSGEAIALDVGDLDTDRRVLQVSGKYGKRRLVPLHPSSVEALTGYVAGRPAEAPLLVGVRGKRLNATTARAVFRALAQECELETRPGCGAPRLHDFRHSFAVHSLTEAQRTGSDVDARVAVLADYLGHVDPTCTYWYLEASPQLMTAISERVAAALGREHR